MTLLNERERQQVGEAITRIERDTDAEIVTVLARQADDYTYIPLLWAGLAALLVPGAVAVVASWLGLIAGFGAWSLLLVQWLLFSLLALAFRWPPLLTRLIPRRVRFWRAANLARRQFLEQNLHRTEAGTGMLIFVSEAERYVEILVDHGISQRLDDSEWGQIVARFTAQVQGGRTLAGFLDCIEACGERLKVHLPATHERNELPNRLIVLE
ncbi:TPM domain-containing protein [Salinicola sp. DM10]|uniref:TPM domain-containing protein n=1 Tax=Salinicola sp. DM10 TaxID=2815721 RepID=UPI001A8FE9BB|nr:TPM domain-containing protein [Salinicola sp. DM10]MCE3026601.1 TPM domain-containing protein [Salinicola sp. DM10]